VEDLLEISLDQLDSNTQLHLRLNFFKHGSNEHFICTLLARTFSLLLPIFIVL
jgi:hypothetical protein